MNNVIHLATVAGQPRVDSRELASQLGTDHRSSFRLISQFAGDFEQFGQVRFEIAPVKTAGSRGSKRQKYALLNEDQCYLLLSYSRNTARVRGLKVRLVQAFGEARRAGHVQALTVWQQLQQLQLEDADSFARASFGSHLMLDRKRRLPCLRERQQQLEHEVAPDLFTLPKAA